MRPRIVDWLITATGTDAWHWLVPQFELFLALAFVVTMFAMFAHLEREGFSRRLVATCGLLAWAGGLVGARLFSFLMHLPRFLEDPTRWHILLHGGLVAYGGYLGAAGLILLYLRRKGEDMLRFADVAVPYVGIGTFFGRVGCFFAGCDFGQVSSVAWAVRYPQDAPAWKAQLEAGVIHSENFLSAPVHPTQLYSAAYGLGLFLLFRFVIWPRRRFEGQVLLLYTMAYALCRSWVEGLRGDAVRGFVGPLSTSQAVSVLLFAVCATLLWRLSSRRVATG